ncbi:MAG TPA: hypothetical protein VM598_00610 [Bdellovibrionota bacterium]|nr:hypothetical protein [Bdellovibrionota bacterium]
MRTTALVALAFSFVLSSCRGIPLEVYVERIVDLRIRAEQVPAEASGTLVFYQVTQLQHPERLCDSRRCRQEQQEEEERRTPVRSRIEASIFGQADLSGLIDLKLGVRTTSGFVEAFDEPSRRPDGFGHLWEALTREDRTLIMLRARGLRLVPGQQFMALPREFRRGDTVRLEIAVEPAVGENDAEILSVAGSTESFPKLEF